MMVFAMTAAEYHWALDLQIWSGVIFFLLLTVLAVFVAPGIGKAMRQRQESIVGRVKQAEIALKEIEALRERHRQERKRMAEEAIGLLKEAKKDAVELKEELVARAAAEVNRTKARSDREISLLTQKAMHELWTTSAELSLELARRIAESELTADDQNRLIDSALQEIGQTQEVSA